MPVPCQRLFRRRHSSIVSRERTYRPGKQWVSVLRPVILGHSTLVPAHGSGDFPRRFPADFTADLPAVFLPLRVEDPNQLDTVTDVVAGDHFRGLLCVYIVICSSITQGGCILVTGNRFGARERQRPDRHERQ